MRVLLTVQGYPPELEGGTERHVRSLARGLVARGHEVTVLAGSLEWRDRLRWSRVDADGVHIVRIHRDDYCFERWERLFHPGVSRMVARLIGEVRPDVMHVHHWLRLTSDLVRQGALQGVPVVVTLHDFTASCPTLNRVLDDGSWCGVPAATAPCRQCVASTMPARLQDGYLAARRRDFANELQLATRVLALSRSHARRLAAVLGVGAPAIGLQPFVSGEQLWPSPVPPPPPPFRIVSLGNLDEHKGQHVLLDALHRCGHREQIELHLYGTAASHEYHERLRVLADPGRVFFHGRYEYEDLERTPFHLAVLPSLSHESYGLVLDEVRMLGLPAIVSDRGAYKERVGLGGEVVPAGDGRDLARRIDRLFDEPERLARLRAGVTRPTGFDSYLDFIEREYQAGVESAPSVLTDRFDWLSHLELEFIRGDACERDARAWQERARGCEEE